MTEKLTHTLQHIEECALVSIDTDDYGIYPGVPLPALYITPERLRPTWFGRISCQRPLT